MEFRDYVPTRVLHDFVQKIETLDIAYMLTGSMAMMRYTVFRQTADIDIIIELSEKDKSQFINVLEPDYYVPHQAVSRAIEANRMFNVIHQDTAFKVDCVLKKKTDFQKSAFERREKTDYYGRDVWVISKEDLILSKLWWAKDSRSEMQIRDIKNLMRAGFDAAYAEKWIDELGVRDSYSLCRKEIED
ncbi:MAG: hypothetical protein LH614_00180 [Pyrinomonadaceae bacterium]|nr:hypothetical protein [Pyrinomonadaceae bacterium]